MCEKESLIFIKNKKFHGSNTSKKNNVWNQRKETASN